MPKKRIEAKPFYETSLIRIYMRLEPVRKPTPDDHLEAADRAKLSATEALAAIDVVVHGLTPIEAAKGCGLPPHLVKRYAARLRAALEKIKRMRRCANS